MTPIDVGTDLSYFKKDVIYRRTIYYWMKMFCLQQLLKYCYLYFSFLSFLFHYVNEFFFLRFLN